MEKEIICRFCDLIYDEPRSLPCGENICTACTNSAINKIKCVHCDHEHEIPLNGFPKNQPYKRIMSTISKSYSKYLDLKSELAKFKETYEFSRDKISQHCKNLVDQIELQVHLKIKELNELKLSLVSQINDYEKNCLDNFDLNQESIQDDKFVFIINRVENELNSRDLFREDSIEKIETLKQDLLTSHQELYDAIFNGDFLVFDRTVTLKNTIGTLKNKKTSSIDRRHLTNYHLIDFSSTYPLDNTLIRCEALKNGTYAICYVSEVNMKLTLEIHDFKKKLRLSYFEYFSKNYYNSLLKSYDNVIVLVEINSKHMVVLDLTLSKKADKNYTFNVNSIFCADFFIGALDNSRQENRSYVYLMDYELNHLITIENDPASMSFPNPIEYCAVNESYFFFCERECINVLNRNGTLVNKINFSADAKIIAVNSVNLVFWNRKEKCVVYMDFKGNVMRRINLINFNNENYLDILVEQNEDKLVFIDSKRWTISKI